MGRNIIQFSLAKESHEKAWSQKFSACSHCRRQSGKAWMPEVEVADRGHLGHDTARYTTQVSTSRWRECKFSMSAMTAVRLGED